MMAEKPRLSWRRKINGINGNGLFSRHTESVCSSDDMVFDVVAIMARAALRAGSGSASSPTIW